MNSLHYPTHDVNGITPAQFEQLLQETNYTYGPDGQHIDILVKFPNGIVTQGGMTHVGTLNEICDGFPVVGIHIYDWDYETGEATTLGELFATSLASSGDDLATALFEKRPQYAIA